MLKRLLIAMLALCLLVAAPVLAEEQSEKEPYILGPFSMEDLNGGDVITEAVFADASITLVNLWATWCGYCIDELPDLAKLSDMTDGKVQVISVLIDAIAPDGSRQESNIEAMEILVGDAGVKYPVLQPDTLFETLGRTVEGVPATFIVDDQGMIQDMKLGAYSADQWLEFAQAAADKAYDGDVTLAK